MPGILNLAGLFPPIPTPFSEDGVVHYPALESNLQAWQREPLAGVVVGGSNGEFVLLTTDERVDVVRHARQIVPRERLLIAGAGAESTRQTLTLCERMAEAGADALLLVTPSYYRAQMSARALVAHYQAAADAAPVPVVLYNVPANTGMNLPEEAVLELAHHPNIAGMKDSGGDLARLARIVEEAGDRFQLLAGSAEYLLSAMAVGAVGAVSALANVAAGTLAELLDAFHQGDLNRARQLQALVIEPNRAVTSRFGVPGLKAAVDMVGLYGGPVRPPLQALTSDERERVREIFEAADLV